MSTTMIDISYDYKGKRKSRKVAARILGSLAYHPTVNDTGFWTVTHVASGWAIYRCFLSCTQAKDVASQLAGLDGWEQDVDAIIVDSHLKMSVTAVMNSCGLCLSKDTMDNEVLPL